MPKRIVIVDDLAVNRRILYGILCRDYEIQEAVNGEEALRILSKEATEISAVLLDIGLPGIDGYEVLRRIRSDKQFSFLSVIMITANADDESRVKALSLGADDYVMKPYNAEVLKHSLRNAIALQEASATINALKWDKLTGLYSREAFFEEVRKRVSTHEPGFYIMSCFDITKFKVINDLYGMQKGDQVLQHIADVFLAGFTPFGGVCCRVSADNYAVLYPESFRDSKEIIEIRKRASQVEGLVSPIIFNVGRYRVDDLSLPPAVMYDRALLAVKSINGRFDTRIVAYDETMRERMIREQEIVHEMEDALKNRHFEVWYQPQYNHTTGAMIGAEALVRWRHPEKGLVSPEEFISVFEKNGFIYSLDQFVWEEVCRNLRKWLDAGQSPLPVSFNISRYDVFRPDMVDVVLGLVKMYGLPVDLLRLEITESAFAQSSEKVVEVVEKLVDCGFTVEIDDFGSGYSSLNILKDVPAQVIKLDMKFLQSSRDSQRGGNIVGSVVRMAKWLGMSVIAEGVETIQQADFLHSIGCSYMQGFLYSKPLPLAQYEEHCRNEKKEEHLLTMETVENLDNNAFWNPESLDALIFNSYVGAACILEYHQGRIELIRATEKYAHMIGSTGMTIGDALKLNWTDYLDEESRKRVFANLEQSKETKKEVSGDYVFTDLPGCSHETYLRATLRVIASAGERCLVYCTNENITAQKEAEEKERQMGDRFRAIMASVDFGVIAVVLEEGSARYLFANDQYYEMLGYTKEQFEAEIESPFHTIAPEDRQRVMEETARVGKKEKTTAMVFSVITRDGRKRCVRATVSNRRFSGTEKPVQLSVLRDITDEVEAQKAQRLATEQLMDNLPSGAALYDYCDGALTVIYLNRSYWNLVGRQPRDCAELIPTASVHPDDMDIIAGEIAAAIDQSRDMVCDIRLHHETKGFFPVHLVGRIQPKEDGKYSIYTSFTPLDSEAVSFQQMFPLLLSAMMESTSDLSFAKSRNFRYISASRSFAKMVGLETEKDLIGKTDYDLFPKELADKYRQDDEDLLKNGKPIIDIVESIPSPDDIPHYSSTSKYLLRDGAGTVIGLYGVGRDVTRHVAQDSRLQLVNDSIPGGLATYVCVYGDFSAENIRLTYFNDGFCRLFGFTRQEYTERAADNPIGMVFDEDIHIIAEQWKTLMEHDTPINCIYRAHVNDGSYKWINHRAVATDRKKGRVVINAILQDVTDQRELIEQLRISEEENNLAVRQGGNIISRYVIADKTLSISHGTAAAYSLPEVIYDVPEEPIRKGMIATESVNEYLDFFESIRNGSKSASAVFQQKYFDGWRWMEAKSTSVFSGDGKPVKAVISFCDVTERLEREAIYRKWQQSLENRAPESYTLFRCNLNHDAIYATVEGNLLSFDFDSAGTNFNERANAYLLQRVFAEDRERYGDTVNSDVLLAGYYRGKRADVLEYREIQPDGSVCWLRLTIDLVEYVNSSEVEAYLMYENIDEAKRIELQTIELSETDPLTGLLNRNAFSTKTNQIIRSAKRGTHHALLMLDIDGFKQVNDAFGHATGDQVLVDVATGLRSMARRNELVGRLGGDEFLVFMSDILSDESAARRAEQICAMSRRSFSIDVQISGSVGIAIAPNDGACFEMLYKKADRALYSVKDGGKDHFAFFDDTMEDEQIEPGTDADDSAGGRKPEKKRRMLIVDDNKMDFAFLQNCFRGEYVVEKARDGASAMIRLRHFGSAITVVLLDLILPGMNGFAVLERMQSSPELRSIPVIIVSGDDSRETCLKAIRMGATDYITKPVDTELLRLRVQSAVNKAENERLRARNCIMEIQNEERLRYESAMESTGITFVECNWLTGEYSYHPSVSNYLLGTYDNRKFWQVLLSDMVADTQTVQKMQQCVHSVAEDRNRMVGSICVNLRTPNNAVHRFRMVVRKLVNDYQLTNRLIIALNDLDFEGS